jgi:DNA (cytosine-5)-methyltransferase 1
MQKDALGGAYYSWGGRSGFLRRLAWDKPAPTITSCPTAKATMLCHPSEVRPLTVRECARIQQFPDEWQFSGNISQQYKQIGNATPIAIGFAIGREIIKLQKEEKQGVYKGKLICSNKALLERIIERPTTQLNPPRMRLNKNPGDARKWLNNANANRHSFNIFHSIEDISLLNGEETKKATS